MSPGNEEALVRRKRLLTVAATTAALALTTSLALAASSPDARAGATGRRVPAPAVPRYYMALPGEDNFANVPGAPTAVVADTFTGTKLLTVRPFGKGKFVTVSAAADDRTFVLSAAPGLEPPAVPSATTWYLVRAARPGIHRHRAQAARPRATAGRPGRHDGAVPRRQGTGGARHPART